MDVDLDKEYVGPMVDFFFLALNNNNNTKFGVTHQF